jgi:hypothetical protein
MDNNVQSILKFNLDTQEGRDAHMRACKAEQAYRALHEIQEKLRQIDKYDVQPTEEQEEFVSNLRSEISNIIIENGIDLSEEYK